MLSERPLRVIHSEAATGFGGQEGRIFKEMCAMRARGHHMAAVCQPHARLTARLRDEGFMVYTMLMDGPRNYFAGLWRLQRILRAERFDVLNTHSRRDTMLAGVAARLAGTPLIVRTRHLAIAPGSLLSYTVVPHCVTTVSDYVGSLLRARGVAPERLATVYSPIPMPEPVAHSTLRAELGLPPDAVVVGCVAVMRAKKGHQALIDAMRRLFDAHPRLYLVLVGDGAPMLEKLQQYVRELGLGARVLFTGRRQDIPNVLAGFDIFALATEQEASGTVFVEAAAAGLPVVGTDVGGVSEMFQDGQSGILVPPGDQAALAAAIERLVLDADLRADMGRCGMQTVRSGEKFSTTAMVERTEQCYSRWLRARQAL